MHAKRINYYKYRHSNPKDTHWNDSKRQRRRSYQLGRQAPQGSLRADAACAALRGGTARSTQGASREPEPGSKAPARVRTPSCRTLTANRVATAALGRTGHGEREPLRPRHHDGAQAKGEDAHVGRRQARHSRRHPRPRKRVTRQRSPPRRVPGLRIGGHGKLRPSAAGRPAAGDDRPRRYAHRAAGGHPGTPLGLRAARGRPTGTGGAPNTPAGARTGQVAAGKLGAPRRLPSAARRHSQIDTGRQPRARARR